MKANTLKLTAAIGFSAFFLLLSGYSNVGSIFRNREPDAAKIASRITGRINEARLLATNLLQKSITCKEDALFGYFLVNLRDELERKEITLLLFNNEKLIFWSNNIDITDIRQYPNSLHLYKVLNTVYIGEWITQGERAVLALTTLRYEYPYQNKFIKNRYADYLHFMEGYRIVSSTAESSITVPIRDNLTLHFSKGRPPKSRLDDIAKQILQWASFSLLLFSIFLAFKLPRLRKNRTLKILGFPLVMFGFRYLSLKLGFPAKGYGGLFGPELYAHSTLNPSLGDFAVNALLVFIAAIHLYRSGISVKSIKRRSQQFIVAGLSIALVWGIFVITDRLFASLVMHSTLTLETYRIFNISVYSVLGYVAISLWIATLILAVDLWAKTFKNIIDDRALVLLSGSGLILATISAYLLGTPPSLLGVIWAMLTFTCVFVIRSRALLYNSSWLLMLVFVLSLYSVLLVNDNTVKKDREVRKLQAISLSSERDPVAESLFDSLSIRLANDSLIKVYLQNIKRYDIEMYDYLRSKYFSGYFKKYDLQATICFPGSDILLDDGSSTNCNRFFEELISDYGMGIPFSSFYFMNNQNGRISYLGEISYAGNGDWARLYIELDSKQSRELLGYPELLLEGGLSRSKLHGKYSYAKYHKGQLITQSGSYPYRLSIKPLLQGDAKFIFFNQGMHNHLVYQSDKDNAVVLSSPRENPLNTTASFAYMFIFFYLVLILWLTLSKFPIRMVSRTPSFKNRIKTAMVLVIILSLIMVASITIVYSIRSFKTKNEVNLSEKLLSVMVEVDRDIVGRGILSPHYKQYLSDKLIDLSNIFYSDINIYDTTGTLLATSRPEVLDKKLVGRKMNPVAWYEMAYNRLPKLTLDETIGSMSYLSAYVPLNDRNNRTVAYLNLPYFTRQGELIQELYSVIVAILNIYALLILIAIGIAILISNQISRPLELIRQKIRRINISSHNEPIRYSGKDEVGQLISEYNRMVAELAHSAEQLARSQRESAWREMARQIAHEIKNPLTPMKLSLQHLVKAKKDGVADWDQRFEKFSASLIEQINTLSNIATQFSNFAKMPELAPTEVDLNTLFEEIQALFDGYRDIQVQYRNSTTSLPLIKADKEQLLRVFVNLVKNAIQSVERGKAGTIVITLEETPNSFIAVVADNGAGIPDEIKPKLFSPNFTTKSGGMGLGLAITKGIVENSGGKIWFETQVNEGSKFFVELPKPNG